MLQIHRRQGGADGLWDAFARYISILDPPTLTEGAMGAPKETSNTLNLRAGVPRFWEIRVVALQGLLLGSFNDEGNVQSVDQWHSGTLGIALAIAQRLMRVMEPKKKRYA